jgi:hypothetical protein
MTDEYISVEIIQTPRTVVISGEEIAVEVDGSSIEVNLEGGIGPQGFQGSQGFQGDFGGPQGFQGAQGFQGQSGTQGNQGFQGRYGSDGAQGPQGFQGLNGTQGPQGNQGISVQGPQGFQGSGVQGNQGTQGLTGSGAQGNQGAQGAQGNQGVGVQGNQGAQGNQVPGAQGDQGTQGNQGSGTSSKPTLSTGMLTFSSFTIADDTHVSIGTIKAVVVDNVTDPENPSVLYANYAGGANIPVSFIDTCDTTYFVLDEDATLVQLDHDATADERVVYARVGWADHPDRSTVSSVYFEPDMAYDIALQFVDFMESYGAFNFEGNEYGPQGATLGLHRTAGKVFDNGTNASTDLLEPNVVTSVPEGPIEIYHYYRKAGGVDWNNDLPSVFVVDPGHWDDGSGVLADVPTGKFTTKFISYYAPTNSNDLQYGQKLYDSIADAYNDRTSAIAIDSYNYADVFRGWLIVQEGCVDLTDANGALFVVGKGEMLGRITGVGASGGGGPQGPQGNQGTQGTTGSKSGIPRLPRITGISRRSWSGDAR